MSESPEEPLWCPNCGGREWTRVPGGSVGFSHREVTCNSCGKRYLFAENLGAHLAREEQERREQDRASTEGTDEAS